VALDSRLIVPLLLVVAVSACTKVTARTPDPPPGLATPNPPDRLIVPVDLPEPVEPPPTPPPAAPPPVVQNQPPRPRVTPTAPTPPPAAAAEAPSQPPPVLQTTLNPAELEQQTKTLIDVARKDLDRVAVSQLTASAREQYDQARKFLRQADDAVKIKNLALAQPLAEKAASLANQLPKK